MSEKTLAARARQRHNTEAAFKQTPDLIPKNGELIIYDPDEDHKTPRFKVGDGVTAINDLPFAAGYNIGSVRIDTVIEPGDWTQQADETWSVLLSNEKVVPNMDIVEFTLEDAGARSGSCEIETQDGAVRITASKQQEDPWTMHLTLVAAYSPETIDYPRIAMVRVPVEIGATDWIDNADGTVSATVTHSNIFKEMSLIEWEPDDGYDFKEAADYETFDGSIVFTMTNAPSVKVSGYITLGVDSAAVDGGTITGNVVTSVNGQTGDVTVPIAVESIDGLSYTISSSAWTAGTFTYAGDESGACYYYEADCTGSVSGYRFVATSTSGNSAALYITPLADKLYLETATLPNQTVRLEGYVRKEKGAP